MKNEFLKDVLREDAESNRPGNVNLWPAVRGKLPGAKQTSQHKQARWLGRIHLRGSSAQSMAVICATAVLAVMSVASLTWFLFPGAPSVSAAQVLARANQAVQDPDAFGVRSLEGIAIEHYTGKNDDQDFAQRETHIWFQTPDKERREVRSLKSNKMLIFVSDGTISWSYDPEANSVRLSQPVDLEGIDVRFDAGSAFGATSLGELLQQAEQGYDVQMLGSEQVAGRRAHVLQLTPKVEGSVQLISQPPPRTLWIDQETYLVLGYALTSETFNFSTGWSYTSLQLNVDLDPDLFAYDVPMGAKVIQEEDEGPTGRLMREQWEALASRVPFTLFRFETLDDSFVSVEGPVQDSNNPNRIVERFRWLPDEEDTLTLIEEPGPLTDEAKLGERIQIGPFVGYWQQEGPIKRLTWEQEGTVITLVGRRGIDGRIVLEYRSNLGRVKAPATPAPSK